jgi:hypothetical protein
MVYEGFTRGQEHTGKKPHGKFISFTNTLPIFLGVALRPQLIEELNIDLRVGVHVGVKEYWSVGVGIFQPKERLTSPSVQVV